MSTMEQAQDRARNIFTKPGLAARVLIIQGKFNEENADGTLIVESLRLALIEQGEYDFEQEIKGFPVEVKIPRKQFLNEKYGSASSGQPSRKFADAEEWLAANMPGDEYLAFPANAVGKYKDCCFNVYFKTSQWAVYFKVGYII